MKNINHYIFEKLKIDKDIKVNKKHDMYYVIPRSDIYKECIKKYELSFVNTNNYGWSGFILWDKVIKSLLKKYKEYLDKYPENFTIYEIPDKYNNTEEFKNDIEKKVLNIENLTKIENEEFK